MCHSTSQHRRGIMARKKTSKKKPKTINNIDAFLKKAFYDPKSPVSYFGPEKIFRYAKEKNVKGITRKKIKDWLKKEEAYTLYKGSRKKFPRNRIVVEGPNQQWDADLMDMGEFSTENDGVKYVLMVIDLFSRYGYTILLENKKAETVAKALDSLLKKVKPVWLRTDKGGEFVNAKVKKVLDQYDVGHTVTQNETKANYAERFIKTMKNRIIKVMLKNNNVRYVDALPDLTASYNNSYHRSIKEKPANVTDANKVEIYQTQYIDPLLPKNFPKKMKKKKFAYKIGETVRISHLREKFSREYDVKWTGEVFTIRKRVFRDGVPVYYLTDYGGQDVKGTFYQPELQSVTLDKDDLFKLEKVLKTRGRGQNKESLVKWLNWPDKYNSWVKTSTIESL